MEDSSFQILAGKNYEPFEPPLDRTYCSLNFGDLPHFYSEISERPNRRDLIQVRDMISGTLSRDNKEKDKRERREIVALTQVIIRVTRGTFFY